MSTGQTSGTPSHPPQSLSGLDLVIGLAVMAVWGLNFAIAKLGTAVIPPLWILVIRFTIVGLMLLPFVPAPRNPDQWRAMLGLSVTLGLLHFGLMFTGVRLIDSSTAAIVGQLQVPFSTLLAFLIFKDVPGWRRIVGMALAFLGVIVVAAGPNWGAGQVDTGLRGTGLGGSPVGGTYLFGVILVASGAFVWAIANIQIKRVQDLPPLSITAWVSILSAPQLAILSFILEDGQIESMMHAGFQGWFSVFYMVFGATLFCYSMWYSMMRRYPISLLTPFTLTVPVFGVLGGVLLLGEPLTAQILIGGAITLVGVFFLNRTPKPKPQ